MKEGKKDEKKARGGWDRNGRITETKNLATGGDEENPEPRTPNPEPWSGKEAVQIRDIYGPVNQILSPLPHGPSVTLINQYKLFGSNDERQGERVPMIAIFHVNPYENLDAQIRRLSRQTRHSR